MVPGAVYVPMDIMLNDFIESLRCVPRYVKSMETHLKPDDSCFLGCAILGR